MSLDKALVMSEGLIFLKLNFLASESTTNSFEMLGVELINSVFLHSKLVQSVVYVKYEE